MLEFIEMITTIPYHYRRKLPLGEGFSTLPRRYTCADPWHSFTTVIVFRELNVQCVSASNCQLWIYYSNFENVCGCYRRLQFVSNFAVQFYRNFIFGSTILIFITLVRKERALKTFKDIGKHGIWIVYYWWSYEGTNVFWNAAIGLIHQVFSDGLLGCCGVHQICCSQLQYRTPLSQMFSS